MRRCPLLSSKLVWLCCPLPFSSALSYCLSAVRGSLSVLGLVMCAGEVHGADWGSHPASPSVGRAHQGQRSALTQDGEACEWFNSQNHCSVGDMELTRLEEEGGPATEKQNLEAEVWEVCLGDPGHIVWSQTMQEHLIL